MNQNHDPKLETDSNRKPITGGSGTHPLGIAVGVAGGAVAGAAIGTAVGGPIGGVVGGAIGVATGAVAGLSAAEAVNPTVEDAYWSANYLERDYVEHDRPYTDYRPAFQYGWESRARLGDQLFRDVESELERGWELAKGESKLAWTEAKHAASDAWHRLEGAGPVDTTRSCH
jgi:hypothetical protein